MKRFAVQGSAAPQSTVDYLNAANVVSCYAASVQGISIPDLLQPPPRYGDYVDAFANTKLHVEGWMTEVIPSLNIIPQSFVDFNVIVQKQMGAILSELGELDSGGDTTKLEQTIRDAVSVLQREVGSCKTAVDGLDTTIENYQATIEPDAQELEKLTTAIAAAATADQAEVDKQNAVMANLASLVKNRNQLATLNTVGNADLNIFLAVVGVAVGLPFGVAGGVVVGLVFGIGAAAFTSFYAVNSDPDLTQSIADIQTQMTNVSKEIGWLNSTIGLLQTFNSQVSALVAQCDTVQGQAAVVLDFWEQQDESIASILTDLGDILDHLDEPGAVEEAEADIQAAKNSWATLASEMKPLGGVTYTVSQVGTASAAVSAS